jgi:hypothetical protein
MIFSFEANVKKMMKGCTVISIEDELQEFMLTATVRKPQTEEKKKTHKALYPLSKTQLTLFIPQAQQESQRVLCSDTLALQTILHTVILTFR